MLSFCLLFFNTTGSERGQYFSLDQSKREQETEDTEEDHYTITQSYPTWFLDID